MFYPFLYQITNMCYTVAQKPLAATPAFVKIPVIAGYWFIMMFGLGYCNVAFNLLTFKRFHGVRIKTLNNLFCEYSRNSSLPPPLETWGSLSTNDGTKTSLKKWIRVAFLPFSMPSPSSLLQLPVFSLAVESEEIRLYLLAVKLFNLYFWKY